MPEPFSRSLRSLRADSFRFTMGALIIVAALAMAWLVWFFFSKVSLYAVTDTARLEVDQQAYPVDAPISGRVVATYLRLGKQVQQGDLLLELDFEQIRYQLEETKAKKTGLSSQLEKLREEIRAQTQALSQAQKIIKENGQNQGHTCSDQQRIVAGHRLEDVLRQQKASGVNERRQKRDDQVARCPTHNQAHIGQAIGQHKVSGAECAQQA